MCQRRNAVHTNAVQDTPEGLGLDGGGDRRWGQRGVQAEQVGSETGNVGGSHGGSRERVSFTVVPSGDDVGTYDTGQVAFKTAKGLCIPGAQTSRTEP